MQAVIYGIRNCDTMKKTFAWFEGAGVPYQFHDYKTSGTDSAVLARWCEQAGWEALVNRKGTTWRKLDATTQAAVCDAASASVLLQTHTSAIKRPVIEWQRASTLHTTIGFDSDGWTQWLHSTSTG